MSKAASTSYRPISQVRMDIARGHWEREPEITGAKLMELTGWSKDCACGALARLREEVREEAKQNRLKTTEMVFRTQSKVLERQQQEALTVLESQMSRLSELPEILQALRDETFELKGGKVCGIKQIVKGYSKDGDNIYLTPGSVVKEYLEVEKLILDQERIVTGIAASEKTTAAKAGALSINLLTPISHGQAQEIRPVNEVIEG